MHSYRAGLSALLNFIVSESQNANPLDAKPEPDFNAK